jgi:hypothetical protein
VSHGAQRAVAFSRLTDGPTNGTTGGGRAGFPGGAGYNGVASRVVTVVTLISRGDYLPMLAAGRSQDGAQGAGEGKGLLVGGRSERPDCPLGRRVLSSTCFRMKVIPFRESFDRAVSCCRFITANFCARARNRGR